jgi:putative Ca2+/H+ antiporter (TMEM165/GDT1 family)
LIFLSEIGDKTFFIAALLAMKVGTAPARRQVATPPQQPVALREAQLGSCSFCCLTWLQVGKWISFSASLTSLAVMTFISVAIGVVFSKVSSVLPA